MNDVYSSLEVRGCWYAISYGIWISWVYDKLLILYYLILGMPVTFGGESAHFMKGLNEHSICQEKKTRQICIIAINYLHIC